MKPSAWMYKIKPYADHGACYGVTMDKEAIKSVPANHIELAPLYPESVVHENEHLSELLTLVADAFEDWQEPTPGSGREWCPRFNTYLRGHVIAQAVFTPEQWDELRKFASDAGPQGTGGVLHESGDNR